MTANETRESQLEKAGSMPDCLVRKLDGMDTPLVFTKKHELAEALVDSIVIDSVAGRENRAGGQSHLFIHAN